MYVIFRLKKWSNLWVPWCNWLFVWSVLPLVIRRVGRQRNKGRRAERWAQCEKSSSAVPAGSGGGVADGEGPHRHGAPGGDDLQLTWLLQPTGYHPFTQPHHHGNIEWRWFHPNLALVSLLTFMLLLCFLDGFAVENYPANYTEGMYHSVYDRHKSKCVP